MRVRAGGSTVDNRDLEPIPAPAGASQGARLQGHRPQSSGRCESPAPVPILLQFHPSCGKFFLTAVCSSETGGVCSDILIGKDGGRALLNVQNSLCRQSPHHQGLVLSHTFISTTSCSSPPSYKLDPQEIIRTDMNSNYNAIRCPPSYEFSLYPQY